MATAVDTRTLPYSWYSDPEILRREQERIFAAAWQYVGHTGPVAEPGSFFATSAGHVPLVVTRDRDGDLHGLVNVCRHRGFPVAEGCGRRESLQCAYHAWTYGLDGSLRAAPRSEREPGFDRGELGLRPVQLDTWGPFLFANPDLEATPLADTLGRLPELVADAGIDVDAIRFHHRVDTELEANWKIVCENFLECYHCQIAHPGFSEFVDVSVDAYRLEEEGLFSSQFGSVRESRKGESLVTGEVAHGQFHFLWPSTSINVFPGQANLSIGPIYPTAPTRSGRWLDYFFGEDVGEEWIAELLAFDDQVGVEDRALVEGVQRGVSSGLLEEGRLLPASEHLLAHFQRLTRSALS